MVNLSDTQKSLIVGTVLGDGCLLRNNRPSMGIRPTRGRNARLRLYHGIHQSDYLRWKVSQLQPLFTAPIHTFIREAFGKQHQAISAESRVHPFFTWLREEMYQPDSRKAITLNIAQFITIDALAVWFADDGCAFWRKNKYGQWPAILLATDSLTYDSCLLACEIIYTLTGTTFSVVPSRSRNHQDWKLYLGKTKQVQQFIQAIGPYTPACMSYKFVKVQQSLHFPLRA